MKTPIADFVSAYAASGTARFHMPGHKGKGPLGAEALDVTEIHGADDLFHAEGIIAESERNAAALFGAGRTFYSTEGATLPIKAMLALAAQNAPRGTRPRVLAARNAHKSFLYGCGLLDIDVTWLYPAAPTHPCECLVTPGTVESALASADTPFAAVYLTSPDYLGNVQDIPAIAEVCRAHGVPLLVDNAHGAYLAFCDPVCHPIAQGATMCADSAHKTLPVLTGGAYLHIAKDAPAAFTEGARRALSLFASTSPSYLILQSLDLCNRYLADGFVDDLKNAAKRVEKLRASLQRAGYSLTGNEPLKLTVSGASRGYTGTELAAALREASIEVELADRDVIVLMCSPHNTAEEFARVKQALTALPRRSSLPVSHTVTALVPEAVLSVREALLSPSRTLPVREAVGHICAAPTVSCPPAVPIVMSGERIPREALPLFECFGIETVDVVE